MPAGKHYFTTLLFALSSYGLALAPLAKTERISSALPLSPRDIAKPLSWEELESADEPVLNLSERDLPPREKDVPLFENHWNVTKAGLAQRGVILKDEDDYLSEIPQLTRLEPELVWMTADWLLKEFNLDCIIHHPQLLTYPVPHIEYGLNNYLSPMMKHAKQVCMASPAMLLVAIEGGIQERTVAKLLGNAGSATYKARQHLAADQAKSLRSAKNMNGRNS